MKIDFKLQISKGNIKGLIDYTITIEDIENPEKIQEVVSKLVDDIFDEILDNVNTQCDKKQIYEFLINSLLLNKTKNLNNRGVTLSIIKKNV